MTHPETLRYTKEHEWVRLEEDGHSATMGITDFAQGELGDIVFVELEPEGSSFDNNDVFGTVEAVKAVSDLFMPFAGTIIAHNEALQDAPELVNSDPYGEGWMIRVELDDPSEVDSLLTADEYAEHVA